METWDDLYFGLKPDPDIAVEIIERAHWAAYQYGLSGTLPEPERLHVTLMGIGSYDGLPADAVARAVAAVPPVTVAPFEITFDRLATFRRDARHPIVLLCRDVPAELTALHEMLDAALAQAGIGRRRKTFKPHITLLWDHAQVPDIRLDEPASWVVRDFLLVHSFHGAGRHDHLGRWPLVIV